MRWTAEIGGGRCPCGHAHRTPEAAERCARRLYRVAMRGGVFYGAGCARREVADAGLEHAAELAVRRLPLID